MMLIGLSLLSAAPASAATIFFDSFNRSDSTRVGAPASFPQDVWREGNAQSDDVAIDANRLLLRDRSASASQSISTIGFEDIVLTYSWRPLLPSDAADRLFVTTPFGSEVHRLGASGGTESIKLSSLANNRANLNIRFSLALSGSRASERLEGVRIDNVRLTGTRIAAALPEPSTWLMMVGGFALLASALRRRPARIAARLA
ncbi:PEPxxWA-CTERM sorting domain-containing protein [Sphingomonas sp. Tas61C01]|uniref:PEPxxWA-CTERM sorting domain-containing protein n=1 Tax=Sphingomonas sp. Tas61C01 TaxID=3458297 RepID=UPI00403EDDE7